jgi:hypothetical protein
MANTCTQLCLRVIDSRKEHGNHLPLDNRIETLNIERTS